MRTCFPSNSLTLTWSLVRRRYSVVSGPRGNMVSYINPSIISIPFTMQQAAGLPAAWVFLLYQADAISQGPFFVSDRQSGSDGAGLWGNSLHTPEGSCTRKHRHHPP